MILWDCWNLRASKSTNQHHYTWFELNKLIVLIAFNFFSFSSLSLSLSLSLSRDKFPTKRLATVVTFHDPCECCVIFRGLRIVEWSPLQHFLHQQFILPSFRWQELRLKAAPVVKLDLGKIRRVDSYSIWNAVYFTCETVLVSNNDHFPIPPSKTVEEFEFKLAQWWQIKWVTHCPFLFPNKLKFPHRVEVYETGKRDNLPSHNS